MEADCDFFSETTATKFRIDNAKVVYFLYFSKLNLVIFDKID